MRPVKALGQAIGIVMVLITMLFIFAVLNLSLLGIIASPLGILLWMAVSRAATRGDTPSRKLFTWLFPYYRFTSDLVTAEEKASRGPVDPITLRAIQGAGSDGSDVESQLFQPNSEK